MPQLLKQAGMDTVTFGRGVRPVGFDNEVQENGNYESPYSEMMWESPDGTKISVFCLRIGIITATKFRQEQENCKRILGRQIEKSCDFCVN